MRAIQADEKAESFLRAATAIERPLLQKNIFFASAGNLFLVSATSKDTICKIQKIKHLWYQLSWNDTKNHIFSVWCLCQPVLKINFQ
jgi:hypothetical protein